MKTRTQIAIDRSVGRSLAVLLNYLVRFAGLLLRPDHNLSRPFRTIAVCKFKGMGSIIQATPLLQTLRENYPDARICFVTTPANVSLLKKMNMVDEIIVINDSGIFKLAGSVILAIFRMWKLRIGVYFDLEIYSHFSSLITTLSVSRNRFGFYLRSGNFRMGMYTHMMFFNINAPVSKVYLQMASLLPLKSRRETLYPVLGVHSEKVPAENPYIVINPNASDLRLERRWPAENFVTLTQWLLKETPFHIVFIGAKQETAYVNDICLHFTNEEKVINLAGDTTLDELIGIIANARGMITNDTGPMHLGFSTGCPLVALFGPCSPAHYGMTGKVVCLYKGHYCSPCIHEFIFSPCSGNNICMKDITTEEVIHAFQRLMKEEFDPPETLPSVLFHSTSTDFLPGKVTR